MATAVERWANRRRRVKSHSLELYYNDGDLVILTHDQLRFGGVKKGAIGRVREHVFPLGTSYQVEFEDSESEWKCEANWGFKNTFTLPVECIIRR